MVAAALGRSSAAVASTRGEGRARQTRAKPIAKRRLHHRLSPFLTSPVAAPDRSPRTVYRYDRKGSLRSSPNRRCRGRPRRKLSREHPGVRVGAKRGGPAWQHRLRQGRRAFTGACEARRRRSCVVAIRKTDRPVRPLLMPTGICRARREEGRLRSPFCGNSRRRSPRHARIENILGSITAEGGEDDQS